MRYTVEEKWAVTCDDAQRRWSADWRVLFCKQAVVGSSPTVSTLPAVGAQKCWSDRVSEVLQSGRMTGYGRPNPYGVKG